VSTARHFTDTDCSTLRQPRRLCRPANSRSKRIRRIFRPLNEFTTCQIFSLRSMTAFTFVGGVEHDKDIEPPAAARKRLPVTRQSARQIKAVLAKIDFVTSAGARIVTALFCLIAASSVSPADADEGPAPQPEPFGVFENREEAFCRSTDMQGESHCVCSAAGVEVSR
jgi:hypothetical protein